MLSESASRVMHFLLAAQYLPLASVRFFQGGWPRLTLWLNHHELSTSQNAMLRHPPAMLVGDADEHQRV